MEKVRQREIRDYLHLYLGCEMQYSTHHEPQYEKYILSSENLKEAIEFEDLPILRPLSDMTDREVLDVVAIVLRKEIDFLKVEWTPKRDYVVVHYNTWLPQSDYEKERWERCELNIAIADDFTIYNHANYIKGNSTGVSNEPLYKQHEATRYLLSKGFDLFGLIEEGLAIDKTKGEIKTELI